MYICLRHSEARTSLWPSKLNFDFSTKNVFTAAYWPVSWEQWCYLLISSHCIFSMNVVNSVCFLWGFVCVLWVFFVSLFVGGVMFDCLVGFFVCFSSGAVLSLSQLKKWRGQGRKIIDLLLQGKQNIPLFSLKENQKPNNINFHVLKAEVQWSNIFPFKFASRGSTAKQLMQVGSKSREVGCLKFSCLHSKFYLTCCCVDQKNLFLFFRTVTILIIHTV